MAQAPTGRTYDMTWSYRAVAVFMMFFGVVLFASQAAKSTDYDSEKYLIPLGIYLMTAVFGAGATARSISSQVRFTESAIERRSWFGAKSIPFAEIRGRREYLVSGRGGSTSYLRIVAKDDSNLDFGKSLYAFDDVFWQWFRQLPDLDAEDQRREDEKRNSMHKTSNIGLV